MSGQRLVCEHCGWTCDAEKGATLNDAHPNCPVAQSPATLVLTAYAPTLRIDDKRMSLPYKATGVCPSCRLPFVRDFADHTLCNPTANEPITVTMWCPNCDHEWSVRMMLRVTLSLEPS